MTNPRRLLLVIILALLVPIVPFLVIGELPGERWLTATTDDALAFGATGAGLLALDVLLPVPSSVVGTLLGARLGALEGFWWAWMGMMAGSLAGYLAGRLLGLAVPAHAPDTPTLAMVFLSRPVPVLAEATTIAAGATRMPAGPFVVVAALGNGVVAAALAANGAALLPGALAGPGLILPMALPVAGWLLWHYRGRRASSPAKD